VQQEEIHAVFNEEFVPTASQSPIGTVGVIDGSGFVKHGPESVGVQRQWCGRVGKKENCQVGVFLLGVTPAGNALLNHQDPEGDRRHGEEITGSDVGNVIGQECSPRRRRRLPGADHVLGHRPFRSVVPQQEQFRQESWRAPERILTGHAANQVTKFTLDGRVPGCPGPRLPSLVPQPV